MFLAVFGPRTAEQWYPDARDYIILLSSVAEKHPDLVLRKIMGIGAHLDYDADAVGSMQDLIVQVAGDHTQEFLKELRRLPQKEELSLIKFLADAENHTAYPEYQQLIDKVKLAKDPTVAEWLEQARTERMKWLHGERRI